MTSSSAQHRKILGKIACNWLQKELVDGSSIRHNVNDNLQRCIIEVNGAQGTLYADEIYKLQVNFPEQYTLEAPQIFCI